MARYKLIYLSSIARDLRGVPEADVRRILARTETLGHDPDRLVRSNSPARTAAEFAKALTGFSTPLTKIKSLTALSRLVIAAMSIVASAEGQVLIA